MGKHRCWSLFFNKAAGLNACNFIEKETPTLMFSCEYFEIFESTYLGEHLQMAVPSKMSNFPLYTFKRDS